MDMGEAEMAGPTDLVKTKRLKPLRGQPRKNGRIDSLRDFPGDGKPKADPPDPEKTNAAATGIANGAQKNVLRRTKAPYRFRPVPATALLLLARADELALQFDALDLPESADALIDALDAITPDADFEPSLLFCGLPPLRTSRDYAAWHAGAFFDIEENGDERERDDEDGACWGAHVQDQRDVCRSIRHPETRHGANQHTRSRQVGNSSFAEDTAAKTGKSEREIRHPETRHGGDRKSSRQVGDLTDRFTADTAAKTGRSERDLQRDARRGTKIGINSGEPEGGAK
jgi:hypothetical protein